MDLAQNRDKWPAVVNTIIKYFLFLMLQRACCRVTQLLHQLLHIYKIYTLKTLRRVSVLRPSSGSYIFLA